MSRVTPRRRERSQSEPLNQAEASSFPSTFHGGHRTFASQGDWDHHGMRFLGPGAPAKGHVSEFKSSDMTIVLNSPSIRVVRTGEDEYRSFPLYGDNDHVMGSVSLLLQRQNGLESGQLTISIEGVFEYISPMSATKAGPSQITPGRHRHVFYRDQAVIPMYASSEPGKGSAFKTVIANRIRRTASKEQYNTLSKAGSIDFMKNNQSLMSLASAQPKVFNFDFHLPKSDKVGEELPSTFSCSNIVSGGVRGRVYAENADVRYRVHAVWKALDGSGNQAQVDAPILFQPDSDFQSLDGFSSEPDSWRERPLSKVEGLPIDCFVTIPEPASFSRSSSIPYYVVFRTDRRSKSLTAEMMNDATIAVSLIRCVAFSKPRPRPTLVVQTDLQLPSSKQDSPRSLMSSKSMPSFSPINLRGRDKEQRSDTAPRLFKRAVRSAPPPFWSSRSLQSDPDGNLDHSVWTEKPLPALPAMAEEQETQESAMNSDTIRNSIRLSDSRTLHTDISVGFPKRPRGKTSSPHSHPSLEAHKALPEGLYKSSIPLRKSWFPSMQWQGLQIEYYLQVSVIFDSNEFRGRVPLRIY